jgi:hypothetical protein
MNKVRELYPPKPNPLFRDQLVTLADLQLFKTEILLGIQQLLSGNKTTERKKWLKSYEVRAVLDISVGTLQTLRTNGTLPYTKVGGIIYYDQEDIEKLLSSKNGRFSLRNRGAKIIKAQTR